MSADASTDWRLNMWGALLPQIPEHLLLGKGLAISTEEFDEMMTGNEILQSSAERLDASQGSLALASDYHNGMISLILPFGVWGVLTVLWFLGAGIWVMPSTRRRNSTWQIPS
jgi:O-antigen ligase